VRGLRLRVDRLVRQRPAGSARPIPRGIRRRDELSRSERLPQRRRGRAAKCLTTRYRDASECQQR
jgi:hypothetical protein